MCGQLLRTWGTFLHQCYVLEVRVGREERSQHGMTKFVLALKPSIYVAEL